MNLSRSLLIATAGLATAFSLPSCQIATPATRIAQRPESFASLSPAHQALAQRGEVTEGMSKDGVWIAWGSPSQRLASGGNGKEYELWRYTGLQPIYTTRYALSTMMVGGCNGRHHYHPGMSYDIGPDYVPYTAAEVKFLKDKVSTWERLR